MGLILYSGGKPNMTAPIGAVKLSSLAEGSIIKLNENGVPAEFYVAKHNYESSLNGTGRTLLIRKDLYSSHTFDDEYSEFLDSNMNTSYLVWYKELLDSDIQDAVATTKFYVTTNSWTGSVGVGESSIFLPSVTEYGLSNSEAMVEGSVLPIASSIRIASLNGTATEHWTRTARSYQGDYPHIFMVTITGALTTMSPDYFYGTRPCFTLPEDILFNIKSLEHINSESNTPVYIIGERGLRLGSFVNREGFLSSEYYFENGIVVYSEIEDPDNEGYWITEDTFVDIEIDVTGYTKLLITAYGNSGYVGWGEMMDLRGACIDGGVTYLNSSNPTTCEFDISDRGTIWIEFHASSDPVTITNIYLK